VAGWPVTGRGRGRSQHYCGGLDCGLPMVAFWRHNANAKCYRVHACTRSMPSIIIVAETCRYCSCWFVCRSLCQQNRRSLTADVLYVHSLSERDEIWHVDTSGFAVHSFHLLWSPYVIGQTIIFSPCDFYLLSSSFFFLSSPNLSGRRLDVYHTSTHGVASVRI